MDVAHAGRDAQLDTQHPVPEVMHVPPIQMTRARKSSPTPGGTG